MAISNYAKALFQIAKESDKIDILSMAFTDFMDEIERFPTWVDMMDSPMVPFNEKETMIESLPHDPSFRSFLKMLAEKNRVHYVYDIYHEWTDLTRAHLKIAHLHIISAQPVTKETEERLKKAIQPIFPKHTLSFHITIDPDLIGGMKIIYQGQSLDRSVARELHELYTLI